MVIAPGYDRMPSASAIDLEGEPIDRVLRVRPDLTAPLVEFLDRVAGADIRGAVRRLSADDPARFFVLMQAIAGAYFMDESVRESLGYFGQEAVMLDRGGFCSEDLLERMMASPPRYRAC